MHVPKFTRSHFAFIAETITAMPDHAPTLRANKISVANAFALALAQSNANFDREKFLAACHLPCEA